MVALGRGAAGQRATRVALRAVDSRAGDGKAMVGGWGWRGSGVPWYVWCHACGRYLSVREHALECECECVMHDN